MDHHAAAAAAQMSYDGHQGHNMLASNHQNDNLINYIQPQPQHHQHQGDSMGSMPTMMMMKMYFHFGLGDQVLFESFIMDSTLKLWLTCVALFFVAILLEAIDYSRGYLSCRCVPKDREVLISNGRHTAPTSSNQAHLINSSSIRNEPDGGQQWSCCNGSSIGNQILNTNKRCGSQYFPVKSLDSTSVRLVQSSLHFIRTGISLCLMLVAMTYNVCLIFPILLGKFFVLMMKQIQAGKVVD